MTKNEFDQFNGSYETIKDLLRLYVPIFMLKALIEHAKSRDPEKDHLTTDYLIEYVLESISSKDNKMIREFITRTSFLYPILISIGHIISKKKRGEYFLQEGDIDKAEKHVNEFVTLISSLQSSFKKVRK